MSGALPYAIRETDRGSVFRKFWLDPGLTLVVPS